MSRAGEYLQMAIEAVALGNTEAARRFAELAAAHARRSRSYTLLLRATAYYRLAGGNPGVADSWAQEAVRLRRERGGG